MRRIDHRQEVIGDDRETLPLLVIRTSPASFIDIPNTSAVTVTPRGCSLSRARLRKPAMASVGSPPVDAGCT